jgi:hypothetical protein
MMASSLKVRQTTFIDFFRETVGKKYRLSDPEKKLLDFINAAPTQKKIQQMRISRMKGSLRYKQAVDAYVDQVIESLIPKKEGERAVFSWRIKVTRTQLCNVIGASQAKQTVYDIQSKFKLAVRSTVVRTTKNTGVDVVRAHQPLSGVFVQQSP